MFVNLLVKQHPGGLVEQTELAGDVDAERLTGTPVAATSGWRQGVLRSGVGLGVANARVAAASLWGLFLS